MKLPPFERAITLIKYYEQWHTRKDYPYISYGHRMQLGNKNKPKSIVLTKLDAGNRNILYDLLDFCHYKGKRHPYILRRRWMEYLLLFEH